MPVAEEPAEPHWVTVFSGELIEVRALESGLSAYGFRTELKSPQPGGDRFALQVPAADAPAVQRFVDERWQENPCPSTSIEQNDLERVSALGLRVRYAAFWFPPMVFLQAVSYIFLSGTLAGQPSQHGMSLVASWFSVIASLTAMGGILYAVLR